MGTRALTWTINYPNGQPWAGGVVTVELLQGFTTATQVYPATTYQFTSDADGKQPDTPPTVLGVPDTGTAYYKITKPNGSHFRVYIAAGAAVDLVTLETIAGSSVAPDDLQTLLDAAALVTPVNVITTHTVTTEKYIRAAGTFTVTLPDAVLTQPPVMVRNIGTGVITVAGDGSDTINGAATITLYQDDFYVFVIGAAGVWEC